MKKPVKLLLQGGALTLLTVSFNANAQHLPNYGFNDWKTACGSSLEINRKNTGSTFKPNYVAEGKQSQRPGNEPVEWNGSSVNQLSQKKELVTKSTDGNNTYVQLINDFIGFGTIGSNAPGFLTFGTPWVYAEGMSLTATKTADGGTYGGIEWNGYKPTSIRLTVKRTDNNEENSYVIAYLWNGTFTSKIGSNDLTYTIEGTDCDRAILGYAPNNDIITGDGKLVASLSNSFKSTANQDWETIEIPFEYDELAGAPTMMNVIICAGDYRNRSALIKGTTLLVDDVDFVYPTKEHQGKIVAVDLATDEAGSADANASDWYDATMSVEDWGNIVDQTEDKKGNYSSEGRVTLHSEHGDVVLDNVKITHHDDYIWLEHSTASTTLEGSLHNDGTYMVYYDVNPAAAANVAQTTAVDQTKPYRVKFLDTESASTTGIEEINGEAVKAVVFGGQGYVSIEGVEGVVTIYSLTGAKLAETYVDGEAVIAAPTGVVIATYPGDAVKVMVK